MAFIIKLVKHDDERISNNMRLFDDKESADEYCKIVDEVVKIVNMTIDGDEDEWMVYREEMEIVYK